MPKYRVLIADYAWPDLKIERDILAQIDAELIESPSNDLAPLVDLASDVDAIMVNWAKCPAEVIGASGRCRIVARLGVGLDNIDVAYCTQHGIPVTNVPDYCYIEVAEHAFAMLLCLARKLHLYNADASGGVYHTEAHLPMHRVRGQTLGVVGFGRIGGTLTEMAHGAGMKVLAFSRTQKEVEGVRWTSLDELLSLSDYISLSLPLTADNKHMIGPAQFAAMKPTAYLINCARGGLIDHAALADALAENRIAGAALDVHDPEPPPLDRAPWNDPRVLLTPHTAFISEQSLTDLRRRTAMQVADRLAGETPENVRNPEVLDG